MTRTLCLVALVLTTAQAVSRGDVVSAIAGRPVWDRSMLPKDSVRYAATQWTQEIAVTNGSDRIDKVSRYSVDRKYHVSGGMLDVKGVRSDKYALVARGSQTWVGDIAVLNSMGYYQNNRGIRREYADGTRFDDVLSHRGVVFEHRVREKVGGRWRSSVAFRDTEARPTGYTGLRVTCASCHDDAGSGNYAAGLVPGGDGVFSHELQWSLIGR